MLTTTAVKITSKGQVTIPKEIRTLLGSDIVEFELMEGNVIVKPVKSVGGSLQKYAKKHIPLEKIRDTVWEQVVHERTDKKTA
ncbi:MAG: AbrB/MazE/SpoVT family DNA-binding domain-containing protein [Deltaproteobacteria bacterium]|nr:AbrB/MazE/SpoVT family DNA-binding domain-containing protein [Deltaproteobacteria bacterium]